MQQRLFPVATPQPAPRPRVERIALSETALVEVFRGWLLGDDVLYDHLLATTRWTESKRPMYDRVVDVPRLTATLPADGPGHPVLATLSAWLSHRYARGGERLVDSLSLAAYRDGRDSVAWHGDRMGGQVDDCVVAILSLRGPRRLRLRPTPGGSLSFTTLSFALGHGDLLVMAGSTQRDCEHGVAKVASAPPRMSVMVRSRGVS